ncbi:MAG TPA: hypothetical protein VJ746_15300 [Nitrospira sp.]|nr:hypothetical protein [Nitrospira sp.]
MTTPTIQQDRSTAFNGQGPQPARRPRLSPQERSEQNLRLLQQYGSQVLIPRSTESWVMIRMVYPLNKALAKLRRSVGMSMSVSDVIAAIDPIQAWIKAVSEWLKLTGGELILAPAVFAESPQDRQAMARRSNAHVIVPQTEEVKAVVEQIIRMDRVLVVLRTVNLQDLQNDTRLTRAMELVGELNRAVGRVCESANVKYTEPRELLKRSPKVDERATRRDAGTVSAGKQA